MRELFHRLFHRDFYTRNWTLRGDWYREFGCNKCGYKIATRTK